MIPDDLSKVIGEGLETIKKYRDAKLQRAEKMNNAEKIRYQQQIQQLNQSKMTNELKSKPEPKILEGLLSRLTEQNDRLSKQSEQLHSLKQRLLGSSPAEELDEGGPQAHPETVIEKLNVELSRQQRYLREIDSTLDELERLA